ncbi:hypothetical protein E3N88_39472 [Mikania micrantha]|uniref:CBS domain-containing protein n=1 Tax=Mikania micrantha TaxID=192012 RepID=A0A5N6LXR4_9ASTR|nr:hypothetical protein E3N88_39472 [Mikania micrantha]
MTINQAGSTRRSTVLTASSARKKASENGATDSSRRSISAHRPMGITGERTVKQLRLSKALSAPESTTINEACRRMAARKVDALLVIDSHAILCGILTDKDIATRVVARELDLETTNVSAVMTRNPVFVVSDTLAVEALQKMVQGKFRHLPVVENGGVVSILDVSKCLYDAIARLDRAAEKGKAIAAAVEGVEKHWGTSVSGSNSFLETLRERLLKPSLSIIIAGNSKLVTVSPSDTVLMASKAMHECHMSSAIVTVDSKPHGIITSKDILMRVIAPGLPPESTSVEKVMTPNPKCASIDTPIVEALHTMNKGKFLHLPVVDKDGKVLAVTDVLQIIHAAVASVGTTAGINNNAASAMMQNFWDSAMAAPPADDDSETRSEGSFKMASEGGMDIEKAIYPSHTLPNTFSFKIQDRKGRMHRFMCETHSLADLITAILQRVGGEIDRKNLPQILYQDEDMDMVMLATNGDLVAAVQHAISAGWKELKLHLDYSGMPRNQKGSSGGGGLEHAHADAWASAYSSVAAGAALVAGLGVLAFLRRTGS